MNIIEAPDGGENLRGWALLHLDADPVIEAEIVIFNEVVGLVEEFVRRLATLVEFEGLFLLLHNVVLEGQIRGADVHSEGPTSSAGCVVTIELVLWVAE